MLKKLQLCLLLCASALAASAQVQTGIYPYSSYETVGADSIDRGSLNVHLTIPVVSKRGRGVAFNYQLAFDSQVWTPVGSVGSQVWTPAVGFGLTGQLNEGLEGYLSYSTQNTKCYPPGGGSFTWQPIYSNYVYHDQFGVGHLFAYQVNTCTDTVTGNGASSDGSGYSYNGAYVVAANGQQINPPVNNQNGIGTITDSNGNYIKNNGDGTFTDTLGKTALTINGNGTPSSPKKFTYSTPTGTATVTVNYLAYTVQTVFGCNNVTEFNLPENLPSSVVLADGSTYTFGYEGTPGVSGHVTGRIATIGLPQGGTITYQYTGANNGIVCADGSAYGLTRTGGVTRTYVRSSVNTTSSQTTITDGLNNNSVYNFVMFGSPEEFYETYRAVYQGSTSSGTLLFTRQTCYNKSAYPCIGNAVTAQITQVDTYSSLNSSGLAGTTATYNTSGLQTGQTNYDFGGTTSRGSVLRKETWVYPTSGIANLVSSDSVVDGIGNSIGNTTFSYDDTTGAGHAALVTTSVPQHNSVSGQRGNLTTVTQSIGTSGTVSTASAYEDTGNPVSTTTPSSGTSYNGSTAYAYDSATHAFVITVTPPTPSSGVPLPSTATNDVNSGVALTSVDPNNQTTTYASYDSLLRPTQINYPDGGKTVASWSATGSSVAQYMTGTTYAGTYEGYTGYGLLNWVAVLNGHGYYWHYNCYDSNGNLQTASYAFDAPNLNGVSCASPGSGDTYSYDALGRVLKVAHADGSSVNYSYNGRATKITDENGVSRIIQVDGMGRPTWVCELSSNQLQGQNPAACGLDIAPATGFLTYYAYTTDTNAANAQAVTVTQPNPTSPLQKRVFESDWLGRITSITEPESGTTTYSYVYNSGSGLGLTITRMRPTANQSSLTTLTKTITQLDNLGRTISVTYNDGTPGKTFAYDSSANWPQSGQQTNLKGRLSYHQRTTSAGNATSIYGYDAMGRVTAQYSCQPSGCGNSAYNRGVSYSYNLAGMLTGEGDGAGDTYSFTRSVAGEITGITDSFTDSTDPANIIVPNSVQNGPFGPTSYSLGNGLTAVATYDTLGRKSGGWVCSGSSQSGCSGGTQLYGYTAQRTGTKITQTCDSVLGVCNSFGYDEFGRLSARTVNQGTVQNFTYIYDRFGNRWQQNAPQGGPSSNISFNQSTNIINTSGYGNDALGEITNDTAHQYTYDADGNVISVDNGSTAQYAYDSLNQRVRIAPTRGTYEFVWDIFGRRVSNWSASSHGLVESNVYTDSNPIAIRSGGSTQFEHQNWLSSERLRTSYNGSVLISIASLPWGDGHTPTADNGDQHDFAGMDRDLEDSTEAAQFRQYSTNLGRWQAPDPFIGSYDFTNPQSFNRFSYALNDPANFVDPSGLDISCDPDGSNCVDNGGDGNTDCSSDYTVCVLPPPGNGCSNQPWLCWLYPGAGYGNVPSGGGSDLSSRAPSNRKYHCPLFGPCYQGPAINARQIQCEGEAIRNNALALGADSLGAIPGEGQVLAGVQLAAAGVGFVNSIATNDASGAVASILGGQVTLVSETATELGVPLVKAIPVLGNLFSAGLAVRDVVHGIQDYQACLAGH